METFMAISKDVLKSSLSYVIVGPVAGIESKITSIVGRQNICMHALGLGATFTLANEGLNLVSEGKQASHLAQGNIMAIIDAVAFFSAVNLAVGVSKLDLMVFNQLKNIVPLDSVMISHLVKGGIITGSRVGMNLIDSNPNAPQFLKIIRHPTQNLKLW